MPKTGTCLSKEEEAELALRQAEANKPLRPVTTEEEELAEEVNKFMKMRSENSLEIEEIKRKELTPKPDEIAPDNPQKKELEEHIKRQEEKKTFKFCPHCGGNLDYKLS